MPITHNFVSAIADDPAAEAAGEVLPSHWNAPHDVTIDTADLVDGAVTAAKTDAGVQASLALADSALQSGDNISILTNDSGFITGYTVTEGDVTAHEAALTISHSQVSDYDTELAGKTNTTAFTPTADYHPATKKYVDDSITAGGGYTDEQAQDAVGTILVDSSEIDFTYNDATPSITASIVAGSIDETKLDSSVNASLDLADSALQSGDNVSALTNDAGYLTSVTPAGSNTQVQFNDGGALGADANFVWDKTNDRLGVGTSSPQQELELVGTFRSQAKGPSDNIFFEGYNSAGLQVGVMAEASSGGFGGMSMQGYRPPNSGGAGFFFNGISGGNNTQAVTFQASSGTIGNLSAWNGTAPGFLFSTRTGPTTANNIIEIMGTGETRFNISSASAKGIVVKAAASQTANLAEWQNSSGTVLTSVKSSGSLLVGDGNTSGVQLGAGVSSVNASVRMEINRGGYFYPLLIRNNDGSEILKLSSTTMALTGVNITGLTGLDVAGNLRGTADNSHFGWDSGADRVGFTKKAGTFGALTYGSGSQLAIAQSSGTTIAASNTFSNRLVFNSSGNATFFAAGAAVNPVAIRGAASQTANLQEWQNSSGTVLTSVSAVGKITTAEDIEVTDSTKGVILKSPDGTRWRITVDNSGNLTTTSL